MSPVLTAPDLILAADFGTSAVKVGVVGRDLAPLARATESYPLDLPGGGAAEQLPGDWWAALARGIAAIRKARPDLPERVGAISFAAQMCGVIPADAGGAALRPALVWLDKRSAPVIRRKMGGPPRVLGYGLPFLFRSIRLANGAPSHTGMDPPGKMLWIAETEPGVMADTAHFLDVKDWLIQRATGQVTTTADSANLTWLMDTRRGREGWSPALARHYGLSLDRMPPIVDGAAVAGRLTDDAAEDLGLAPGTPVIGGGGDVSATALGSGAVADGELHICLSSSSWVAGFFDRRVLNPFAAYATITASMDYRPLLIATQESAGSALAWVASLLDGPEADLAEVYAGIGAPRDDDPFFLPWLAGERVPVDEARLRGAFYGLSLTHDANAMKRAAIEGVALNTAWGFGKVAAERGARVGTEVPVVGGAAANPHLAQALADALDRPIRVAGTAYAGIRGAAAMAAPLMGWAPDVWTAARGISAGKAIVYRPDPARAALLRRRSVELNRLRKALIKLYRQREATA